MNTYKRLIDFGTTDLAGKESGSYSGGTVKIKANYLEDLIASARQFHDGSNLLLNNNLINDKHIYLIPGVVCASFACELYLKYLIYKNNKIQIKTHDLRKLFEELPQDDKDYILSNFFNFSNFIKINNNLFEKIRYHNESDEVSFKEQEILNFANFISLYIDSKK